MNLKKTRIYKTLRSFLSAGEGKQIGIYAANASFFIALAVFPALSLTVSILRYTGISVDALTALLEGVIPAALVPFGKKLIFQTYQSTTGTLLSLSAVVALWSASRGIHGLRTGLNAIYGVQENRGWLRKRAVSMVYTFAFLLVLLLTLALHVFGTRVLHLLPDAFVRVSRFRFFLLLFIQSAVFALMYMILPNNPNRFADSVPGAVLSSAGWLIFSQVYSVYVERSAGYANIYGSVYAVALSMLWLYFCLSILFYGGVLNQYLQKEDQGENSP